MQYWQPLYVDKNLKHHGLIQAFSRTNRVLNDTKPHGKILDFRYQEKTVNDAIALFSGASKDKAKDIWLVDPAPAVIEKYEKAVAGLGDFMESSDLVCEPKAAYNLKGDAARINFINGFKEVQRLKTQLEQYTDLSAPQKDKIEKLLPEDQFRSFKGSYLETAQRLKAQQGKGSDNPDDPVQQLDFELVLFASAVIDYDYIMGLLASSTDDKPSKQKMTRSQLIDLISSSANLMDERDDIVDYINSLPANEQLKEKAIRAGYETFKAEKSAKELSEMAEKHGLSSGALQGFVDGIMDRMIFDGEQLGNLMEPLELGWKARTQAELALMEDLAPLLKKQAQGREISGLAAYE